MFRIHNITQLPQFHILEFLHFLTHGPKLVNFSNLMLHHHSWLSFKSDVLDAVCWRRNPHLATYTTPSVAS
jgi:hypothetical protein